jgi:replicative DNA helicase
MSKLKRAQKYIGKKINHHGSIHLIEDVVYVVKDDSRNKILFAPAGLCFKIAANEQHMKDAKEHLENLKERFFKIDAGIVNSEYSSKEELMSRTLDNISETQAQIDHPEVRNDFIKVNSRLRFEIVD